MVISRLLLLSLLFAAPFSVFSQPSVPADKKTAKNARTAQVVDSVMAKMTLRAKIGQLFVTFTNGEFLAEDNDDFLLLKRRVAEDGVGGIIFSTGGLYDQAQLTHRLQKLAPLPLLISQDMEYGAAMRLRGATRLSPAMGIAATGNPANAFTAGKITAREARAVGVHQIYAPVADVNNNPKNPIINVRSYSEDPFIVAAFATQFMKGVQSEGLISTAKHFPGHGDTDIDTHIDMPVIRHTYGRLDSMELMPFRKLIQEGIPSVMSAHISFPNMSSNPATPGTLDRDVLGRLLRDSLQFKGVIITDALTMEAITKQFSPGKAVMMALNAGADIMLMSNDETTALDELEKAVQKGLITQDRIDLSLRKILTWKVEAGLFKNRFTPIDSMRFGIATAKHRVDAQRIARESVTLLRNTNAILPVNAVKHPKVLVVAIAEDETGNAGRVLLREARKFHPDVQFGLHDARTSAEEREQILKRAEKADLLIIGSYLFVRMNGKIQFSKEQTDFLKKLTALKKPEVVISFGNPYILTEFPEAEAHVLAWSNASEQVEQTVPALFGAAAIQGRLPITIPGLYAKGSGLSLPQVVNRIDDAASVDFDREKLRQVDRIIEQAIKDSVFPGAQVAVVRKGVIALNRSYGYHTYEKNQAVKTADVYDVASLTKVAVTTPAVMMLLDQKKLLLTDHLEKFFPEFGKGNKKKVTIRHLLEHNSGLPSFKAYGDSVKSKADLLKAVVNEPLIEKPGAKMVYSDLGFILLGAIVEKVSGESLDKFITQNLFIPAGMSNSVFNPAKKGNGWLSRTVPTENDTLFRKKVVRGEVHDERAWIMGGISGHAGLFTNASDLAAYASLLLQNGSYGGRQFIDAGTVELFVSKSSKNAERALGFDLKKATGSSAGKFMSNTSFGHTGFTGTSIWIDPDREVAIILLTNRVHPYRSFGSSIGKVRSAVADAVMLSLEIP